MKRTRLGWGWQVATVVVAGCTLPVAVARSDESADARRCAELAPDSARLECYDAVFRPGRSAPVPRAATPAAAPAVAPAVAPAAAPAVAPDTALADFGLSEKQIRQAQPPGTARVEPISISSQISQLKHAPTGELVATLDNGQVWRQVDSAPNLGLRPGDPVTVKQGAMGSFFLMVPGQPALRVRRIR